MKMLAIERVEALGGIPRAPGMEGYAPTDPFSEGADQHLLALDEEGVAKACCSLWWRETPSLDGERLGVIGHFFAESPVSGERVLGEALARLDAAGRLTAVGPMNGNTWRAYRFVTESDGRPPILLEPSNPEWWPRLWAQSGFTTLAGYHSSVIDELREADVRVERVEDRLAEQSVVIRPIRVDSYEAELGSIYDVSVQSFVSSFLYTPLPKDAFLGMYLPLRDHVDSDLALLAMRGDRPVGFVFGVPDLNQLRMTGSCDTLIIKTLAVVPGREVAGLGVVLVDRMRRSALEKGYSRVIHALMHDRNASANIGRSSRVFRRYTLFSKQIR